MQIASEWSHTCSSPGKNVMQARAEQEYPCCWRSCPMEPVAYQLPDSVLDLAHANDPFVVYCS